MKNIKIIILALLAIVFILLALGVYKFNYLSNKDGYDADGNKLQQITKENNEPNQGEIIEEGSEIVVGETMIVGVPLMQTILAEQFPRVIFVDQEVVKKESVLDSVYTKLFNLGMKPMNDDTVHNHVFNSGLDFESVSIYNGIASVNLSGQYTPAGVMTDPNLRKQVNAASFQYDTVDTIKVYLNGELFDWCIVDLSGDETGCPEDLQYWIDSKGSVEMMTINVPELIWSEDEERHIIVYNESQVPKNPAVLNTVYEKLFELNSYNGAYNGMVFDSVSIVDGIAEINLSGSWYPVGDMSMLYIWRNVDATAFQYDTVNTVKVYLNGELFDWCIDDQSDGEGGCPEEKLEWVDTREKYNSFN